MCPLAGVTICTGCTRFVSTCIFQLLSQGWITELSGRAQGTQSGGLCGPYHTRSSLTDPSIGGAGPDPPPGIPRPPPASRETYIPIVDRGVTATLPNSTE